MGDSHDSTGITGRRWFRPVVGLWFGVLAAVGMWFMPPVVHAWIMETTQLARAHHLFAPPVTYAGILLLSVIAGTLGFLLGYWIARRLASASAPRGFAPGFEYQDESAWDDVGRLTDEPEQPRRRRVFSAREDIGEEGIAISAPTEDDDYESEYSVEDIPPVSAEEEFEAVYAEMEGGSNEGEIEAAPEPESETEADWDAEPVIAEFSEIEIADEAEEPLDMASADLQSAEPDWEVDKLPEVTEPEAAEPASVLETADNGNAPAMDVPLGDMSIDALLARLEMAMDEHTRIVAGHEAEAHEPETPLAAPEPLVDEAPVGQEQLEIAELPQVSDDDPVIAFLRREASRRMPQAATADLEAAREPRDEFDTVGAAQQVDDHPPQTDAQAALRDALDRLGQATRKD